MPRVVCICCMDLDVALQYPDEEDLDNLLDVFDDDSSGNLDFGVRRPTAWTLSDTHTHTHTATPAQTTHSHTHRSTRARTPSRTDKTTSPPPQTHLVE